MGDVKDALISIFSNLKIYHIIDIFDDDIPESYGLLLSRDWLENLNASLSTNWSQFLLPLNGKPYKIKIELEKHMKYIVTDLEYQSEPIMFNHTSLDNYSFETYLAKYAYEESPLEQS